MQPLVRVENLVKSYAKRTLTGQREEVRAIDGVSFTIFPGATLAVVGESGSGKSTLALCLACLEKPTSGNIQFEGADISKLAEKERRTIRRKIQLIFQDPASSFNPRWSVLEIVAEPLALQRSLSRDEIRLRTLALLEQVGLSPEMEARLPAELSGGQRQRLAIARALTLEPSVLILYEALSALYCSIHAKLAIILVYLHLVLYLT